MNDKLVSAYCPVCKSGHHIEKFLFDLFGTVDYVANQTGYCGTERRIIECRDCNQGVIA